MKRNQNVARYMGNIHNEDTDKNIDVEEKVQDRSHSRLQARTSNLSTSKSSLAEGLLSTPHRKKHEKLSEVH